MTGRTDEPSPRQSARIGGCFAAVGAMILTPVAAHAAAHGAAGDAADHRAVWPVDPHSIVAPYEPPECMFCAGHRGVDLGVAPMEPVKAVLSGTVSFAGMLAGRRVLVVDDGRHRVTYEPVTASVGRGDVVTAGDLIGSVDLAGSHCFPDACLHVGLIEDATDDYLDPVSLFPASAPARLLPLWAEEPNGTPVMRVVAMLSRAIDLL